MADHPSVAKRHKQSLKRHQRNIASKSKLRTLIKKARQLIEAKDAPNALNHLRIVNKALDKAVSAGVIKRNTASRWMSRLSSSAGRAAS